MRKILSLLGAMLLSTTASVSITACGGGETLSTQKVDLSFFKRKTLNIVLQRYNPTVAMYKIALINELKKQPEFNNLSLTDIVITKNDDNNLQNSDIIQGHLNTKIIALSTSTKFTGSKTIDVNITININLNSLPDNVIINNVVINNVDNFIANLINVLDRNPDFINLWSRDINVYKKDTTIPLEDSDIVNNSDLQITITAKSTSTYFKGTKNISVNLTTIDKFDLNSLPDNVTINNVVINNVDDFIEHLIFLLKRIPNFNKLWIVWTDNIDVYKKDTTIPLEDSDIVNNSDLQITITAKSTSTYFKGTKNISVNLTTIDKFDLNSLPDNVTINNVLINNVHFFITNLISILNKTPNFNKLWIDNIDVYKKDTTIPLEDSDIVNNSDLQITITAKSTNTYFKGTKNISVNLTVL